MKTLIVHPQDYTTDFLTPVYASISSDRMDRVTVLRGDIIVFTYELELMASDRLIMLGHGNPHGLWSSEYFFNDSYLDGYAIDGSCVKHLRDKPENIYIWCHARAFVEAHQLRGFYTDMFISEVSEAEYCGLRGTTWEEVDQSNEVFSRLVGSKVHEKNHVLYSYVMEEYGKLAQTNKVARYNHQRLFVA